MEDCKINDAGAVALAEAIKLNEGLTKLSIFSNDDISEQGKFSLVAALNVNVSITEYDGYWLNCWSAGSSFDFPLLGQLCSTHYMSGLRLPFRPGDDQLATAEQRAENRAKYLATRASNVPLMLHPFSSRNSSC